MLIICIRHYFDKFYFFILAPISQIINSDRKKWYNIYVVQVGLLLLKLKWTMNCVSADLVNNIFELN